MAFNEKIKVLIDVDASKGNTGLKGFRSSVASADGAVGKFKAGASSAMATVKANAGAMALAGGAALIAFGVKAVEAFGRTAKAAIDLGKKTGLATEQASRWIGVADDFEVTADDLANALGKVAKTLDSGKWEEYGVATRDAAGNARNSNDIFLDALDVLGRTENATERARIGNELFGKGYAAIAPMVGKTREEYEQMLGAVEKGQVITDAEAAKAERMRLAQDALNDALQEVTLAFGGLVAGLAPVITKGAEVIGKVTALTEEMRLLEVVAKGLALINPFTAWDAAVDIVETAGAVDTASLSLGELKHAIDESGASIENATPWLQGWIDKHADAGVKLSDLQMELYGTTLKIDDNKEAAAEAAVEIETLSDNYSELLDNFGTADVWDNVKDNFDAIAEKGQAAWDAAATGAPDAEKKARDYEATLRSTKEEVIKYAEKVGGIPTETVTNILALIDAGKIAEAEAAFDALKKPITRDVYTNVVPISNKPGSKHAAGTSAAVGGVALVGETGPELVNLNRGDTVTSANETANLLNRGQSTYVDNSVTYITIPNATPEQTAAKIARFNRRNAR